MSSSLDDRSTPPRLFSRYTVQDLWTDPHVARQMLAAHLDPESDRASRNQDFIDRSIRWLVGTFDLAAGRQVLDLGCGPGLYANELARLGATMTGVDFSASSIAHARSVAEAEGLEVDYHQANYLEFDTEQRFDLILLIFADICVLSPDQRRVLLDRMAGWLAPGGRLVFDVYSKAQYDTHVEGASRQAAPEGGFWAEGPHTVETRSFNYPDQMAYLDRHTIIEPDWVREIFNWVQCYDPPGLQSELEAAGWELETLLGRLSGDAYDPEAIDFGVIARPSSHGA